MVYDNNQLVEPVAERTVTEEMVDAAQDAWIKTRFKSAGNHKAAIRAALIAALTESSHS